MKFIGISSKKGIEVVEGINDKNTILISILSDVETSLSKKAKDRYKAVLELKFSDITFNPEKCGDELSDYVGMEVFEDKHISMIEDFVNKHSDNNIMVHCTAGLSRSPAVAIGISLFIKNDVSLLKNTIDNHIGMIPNERVMVKFWNRYMDYTYEHNYKLYEIYDMILSKKNNRG